MDGLQPFHAMEILAEAKALEEEGRTICHLEVGEASAPPAPKVREAVRRTLDEPQRYTHAKGIPALREGLSRYYAEQHRMTVDPERIIVTMGSSAGFILGFLGALKPGATIAVTRPFYPAYLNVPASLGFKTLEIPVSAGNGWRLTARAVEEAHRDAPFDALLFGSPANPTGAVVSGGELERIVAVCDRLGITLFSDEIYHGLGFTGPSVSAGEFGTATLLINSFSKYYCMTGWRLGWIVVPEHLVRKMEIMQQNMFISAPTLSQIAGVAALRERDYYDAQKERYAVNRGVLTGGLAALGLDPASGADGAFYIYTDVSKFTNDSMDFCKRLVREAGVAITPGLDFDRVNGHRFVRFSFAGATETMHRALDRLDGFLAR